MSYYMGDYYRGDYRRGRRGDPFSLGGLFSGIAKIGGGIVGGLVTGGPLGAIAGGGAAITSIIGKGTAPAPTGIIPAVTPPAAGLSAVQAGLFPNPFASTGAQPGPGSVPKSGLGGAISRLLPGGDTGYRKRHRMNVTNPRALRRAIRRVTGFGKIVSRIKRAVGRANTAVGNKHRAATRRRAR